MTWKPDKLDELFTDEKAVSPVVGVALLIAMTVILAAVIGTVVLGLGSNPAQAPQATFTFDSDSTTTADITHDGGDALPADEIKIITDQGEENLQDVNDWDSSDEEWTAGEEVAIDSSNDFSGTGDLGDVRVVWEDSDSDKTSTLGEYTVE